MSGKKDEERMEELLEEIIFNQEKGYRKMNLIIAWIVILGLAIIASVFLQNLT